MAVWENVYGSRDSKMKMYKTTACETNLNLRHGSPDRYKKDKKGNRQCRNEDSKNTKGE